MDQLPSPDSWFDVSDGAYQFCRGIRPPANEAMQISPAAQGYFGTTGIYSSGQVAGWRAVTEAVHAKGGKIVLQLWHVGRISHVSLQPNGELPVSSTGRRANAKTFTAKGFEDTSQPRALRLDELPGIIAEYARAARKAIEAGFDGVEVHGANGYLLEQFLRDSINDRTDAYGGPKENRTRLPLEIMNAIVAEIGAGRTGLRLSPVTPVNDAKQDSDAQGLFNYFVELLAPLKLAFIHVIEGATGGARDVAPFDYAALRSRYGGLRQALHKQPRPRQSIAPRCAIGRVQQRHPIRGRSRRLHRLPAAGSPARGR
jgi:N-ethylmaleimide reductase